MVTIQLYLISLKSVLCSVNFLQDLIDLAVRFQFWVFSSTNGKQSFADAVFIETEKFQQILKLKVVDI